jgi:DNA polymerase type B, organellar and viral
MLYSDSSRERENQYRPRVAIKHIDGKRALKGFTARNGCDPTDLIPDGSPTGEPEEGYKFRGHFLDLRTLAFALTDRGCSLASACEAFEVEHGKQRAEHHGTITNEYIDYNCRDVLATAELAAKLLAEYDKLPIKLQPTKAYSPASIGKAYLQAMGIRPILDRQPDFPKAYLGHAQSAFFGGRTSAHIRKTAVPVVYTDFLSMYPTVNSLMGLWQFVTAREITIVEHCQKK